MIFLLENLFSGRAMTISGALDMASWPKWSYIEMLLGGPNRSKKSHVSLIYLVSIELPVANLHHGRAERN